MKRLETLVRHGFAAIRLLDATGDMVRVSQPGLPVTTRRRTIPRILDVAVEKLPERVRTELRPGFLVFDFGDGEIVPGTKPLDLDAVIPPARPLQLSGSVRDPRHLIQPRVFEGVSLTYGDVRDLPVFPTPGGTVTTAAGEVYGRTCLDVEGKAPAAWCTLALHVEIPPTFAYTFRAQADARGEFRISLAGLPPLPKGVESHEAQLTVELPPPDTDLEKGPDLERYAKGAIVRDANPSADPDDAPPESFTVPVRYGARQRVASPGDETLTVRRTS